MAQSKNITQVYGALKLMYALDNNGARLINIGDPVDDQDGVTKIFLENSINAQILTAGTGISINSNTININEYQPHIIGVGNINTGTWSADTISISYGGTGNTNFPANKLVIGNGSNPLTTTAYLDYDDNYFKTAVPFVISDTSNASGSSLGSLYVAGGVNIRKDLIVSGTTLFTDLSVNNIDSVSVSTSSLKSISSTIAALVVTSLLTTPNIIVTNISASNLYVQNSIVTNSTINNINSLTITTNNLVSSNISSTNLVSTNSSISSLTSSNHRNNNQTSTNLIVTSTGSLSFANINTCSTGNLIVLNSTIANSIISSSNLINSNISTANILSMSVGNSVSTNATISGLLCSNNFSTSATIGTLRVIGSGFILNNVATNSTISNLITAIGTIGNLMSTNSTTSNLQVNTLISSSNIFSTNATLPSLVSTNITSNNINVVNNLRVGNDLIVSGTVTAVNVTSINLIQNNITVGSLVSTNLVSTINLNSSTSTLQNLVSTNITTTAINTTRITSSTLLVTGLISSANVFSTNISAAKLFAADTTTSNFVATAASTGSLDATGITTSTLLVTSLMSSANVFSTNISTARLVATNTTTTNLLATSLISAANLFSTNISTAKLFATDTTTSNFVSTAASTGSIDATGITTSTLLVTSLVSSANVFSTNISTARLVATNTTTTNLLATNVSAGNMFTENITVTNLKVTNSSIATLVATGNSHTLGNIFVNGSNVGIGTTTPQRALHVVSNESSDSMVLANTSSFGYASIKYQTDNSQWYSGVGGSTGLYSDTYYIKGPSGELNMNSYGALTLKGQSDKGIINFYDQHHSIWAPIGLNGELGVMQFREFGHFQFWNGGLLNDQTIKMMINANGNVGIGTADPLYKLDISGNARITNGINTSSILSSVGITTPNILLTNDNLNGVIDFYDQHHSIRSPKGVNGEVGVMQFREFGHFQFWNGGLLNDQTMKMMINANGNVGIGTADPVYKLDISGNARITNGINTNQLVINSGSNTSQNILLTNDNYNCVINFYDQHHAIWAPRGYNGEIPVMQFREGGNFQFWNGGTLSEQTMKMLIHANGNVGIGNDNPTSKLDVTHPGSVQFNLQNTGVNGGRFKVYVHNDTKTYLQSSGDMYFTGIDSGDIRLNITTSGNIGVGTNNPGYKLDVNGTARITNGISTSSILSSAGVTTPNILITTTQNQTLMLADLGSNGAWAIGANNVAMQYQVGGGGSGSHVFYTNSTTGASNEAMGIERMRINGQGNVGIGTNNPYNKLHVVGDVLVNGLITAANMISTNISAGTINSTSISVGNINITGSLSQNGSPYMTSQWATVTTGSISYYSSTSNVYVGINNTNASYALDVTGDSRFRNNLIVSGDMSVGGNFSVGNLNLGNVSTGNIITNNINYGIANTYSASFIAANNISTPTNVTGLLFTSTSSFSVSLSINIKTSSISNFYASYSLEGLYKDGTWTLLKSYAGDATGIVFSITSDGQIQYTSTNLPSWVSTTFRYLVNKISSTGTYASLLNNTQGSYIFNTLQINDTASSIVGSNNGALYVRGGATFDKNITIRDTTNSSAIGSGGSLTVLGGTSVSKDLYVGQNIYATGDILTNGLNLGVSSSYSGSFLASNNINAPSNVTGMIFNNISSFTVNLNITLLRSVGSNLYCYFSLEGNKNDSGWSLLTSYSGDDTGIIFTITSAGQIQYTSTNISNWVSSTFRYNVTQISNTGTYTSLQSPTQGSYSIDTMQLNNSSSSILGTSNGALYSLGGATFEKSISIKDTRNSSGVQTGGALTVLGGASISKNVYMGSNLIVTGDITAFGTISDIRFKSNIQNLTNGLDIINSLRPVTFTWNDDIYNQEFKGRDDVGFVAQEVEKVIPYAVDDFSYSEDGELYKKMRHERIIPYLVEAIKVLTEKVNYLEAQAKSN